MICATCKDSGFRGMVLTEVTFPAFRGDGYSTKWAPCPTCNGSGIAHCCEGDREQPEPEEMRG
jgi:hypothetical protein